MKAAEIIKLVSGTTAVLVLLGMLYGAGSKIDSRYAIAAENQKEHESLMKSLTTTNQQMKQWMLGEQRDRKQNQIWALEEKNVKKKSINEWSPADREKYKILKKELADIDKQIDALPKIN